MISQGFTRFTVTKKLIHWEKSPSYTQGHTVYENLGKILINLSNGRVYITLSVITQFFPVDPDDHVIVELQCTGRQKQYEYTPFFIKVIVTFL